MRNLKTPDQIKRELEPSQEIIHLRDKVKRYEKTIRDFRKGEGEVREILHEVSLAVESAEPFATQYKPRNTLESEVGEVLQITDLHIGAVQDANEIENFGQFSPSIARDRIMNQLVPFYLDWTNFHRKAFNCPKLNIIASGDYISGDIHRELSITNAYPTPVQSVEAAFLFADLVQSLAPHFGEIKIDFLTSDNHGRLTTKPQSKEGALNNFGYVVAYLAKERLRDHKNVNFEIRSVPQFVMDVSGTRYLVMHGHEIQGWGGNPYYGFDRKVGKEAHKRMSIISKFRESVRFDKLVTGHFHAPANMLEWMIGGSLSGTDAHDHKYGRYAPPMQTGWFVHPDYGELDWRRFTLNKDML